MSTRVSLVAAARVVVATSAFGFVTAGFSPGAGSKPTGRRTSDRGYQRRRRRSLVPLFSPPLVCRLRPGTKKLPASSRRGLIDHLLQYPDITLATTGERARAHRVLAQLESAAAKGDWRNVPAAERAGYDTRTRVRKVGDGVGALLPRGATPGAPRPSPPRSSPAQGTHLRERAGTALVLVGAMWSTRDGERGPNPGGPITRWHSHMVCKQGERRGLKAPRERQVSSRRAPHSGKERDAARLVHGRPP